jgi:DNA-binding CsgD family transcriptional regulator
MAEDEFGELVLSIYDCAVDPASWPSALAKTARFLGAKGAFVFELQGLGGVRRIEARYFSDTYDEQLVRQYLDRHNEQELIDQDIFARHSKQSDIIEMIPDSVLWASPTEFRNRPNVQEMREYRIGHRAGALLNKDQINRDRFALQFSTSCQSVSSDQLRLAARVMPHIAKSLNISRPLAKLAESHGAIEQSLDLLAVGVCVIDSRGLIVTANSEFRAQMSAYGIFRLDPQGRMLMRSEETMRSFAKLTDGASSHGRFGGRPRKEAIVAMVNGEEHTLCVEVAPLQKASPFGEPDLVGHIVYSMDTGKGFAIDEETVAPLFALTKAEANVLTLMAEGLTNPQISDMRDRSLETINSQVKSVLEKTGSANRTQAIRLAVNVSSSFLMSQSRKLPKNGISSLKR